MDDGIEGGVHSDVDGVINGSNNEGNACEADGCGSVPPSRRNPRNESDDAIDGEPRNRDGGETLPDKGLGSGDWRGVSTILVVRVTDDVRGRDGVGAVVQRSRNQRFETFANFVRVPGIPQQAVPIDVLITHPAEEDSERRVERRGAETVPEHRNSLCTGTPIEGCAVLLAIIKGPRR